MWWWVAAAVAAEPAFPCPEGTGLTADGRCEVLLSAAPPGGFWPEPAVQWRDVDEGGRRVAHAGIAVAAAGLLVDAVAAQRGDGELGALGVSGELSGLGAVTVGGLTSSHALRRRGVPVSSVPGWVSAGAAALGLATAALAVDLGAPRPAVDPDALWVARGLFVISSAGGVGQLVVNQRARRTP